MALNLYRRHYRTAGKCAGGHPPDFRNYEPEELRRNWKKCHCPIYACGILDGRFQRKNTQKTSWPEAKAVATEWKSAGSWNRRERATALPESEIVKPENDSPKPSITIKFATERIWRTAPDAVSHRQHSASIKRSSSSSASSLQKKAT